MSCNFKQIVKHAAVIDRQQPLRHRLATSLRRISCAALISSGVLSAANAAAEHLVVNAMAFDPAVTGQVSTLNQTLYVGGYSAAWNSDPVLAFCVDLGQTINFQTNYGNYTIANLSSTFTNVEISDMTKLFNIHYDDARLDAAHSAAFQFALWEIVTEASGAYGA